MPGQTRPPANPQKYPVAIGPSAIDGEGAFAQTAIPAKAKIGEIRGEFVCMAQARARARQAERSTGLVFMIAISNKVAVDATQSTDPLHFANHSCATNTVLKIQQGRVASMPSATSPQAKSRRPAMAPPTTQAAWPAVLVR